MNKRFNSIVVACIIAITTITFTSCDKDKDEMDPPDIGFKTGGSYISTSSSVNAGDPVLIGIEAEKSEGEEEDVLKHFNISKSVNGGATSSVYDVDLTSAQEDMYNYDFNTTASGTVGDIDLYTFTITNRDGLIGQVSLSITAQ